MFSVNGNLITKNINGVQDVVVGVNWIYRITLEGCTFKVNGSTTFNPNPDSTFVNYADLTEQTVCGWISSAVSQDELDFYTSVAQEQLDAFKKEDDIPQSANLWVTFSKEVSKNTPWQTGE